MSTRVCIPSAFKHLELCDVTGIYLKLFGEFERIMPILPHDWKLKTCAFYRSERKYTCEFTVDYGASGSCNVTIELFMKLDKNGTAVVHYDLWAHMPFSDSTAMYRNTFTPEHSAIHSKEGIDCDLADLALRMCMLVFIEEIPGESVSDRIGRLLIVREEERPAPLAIAVAKPPIPTPRTTILNKPKPQYILPPAGASKSDIEAAIADIVRKIMAGPPDSITEETRLLVVIASHMIQPALHTPRCTNPDPTTDGHTSG